MILKDFYNNIVSTEQRTLEFLRGKNLLPPADGHVCQKCGGGMKECRKDNRGVWHIFFRCRRRTCRTSKSVRQNSIFSDLGENNEFYTKLSLCKILELMYFFTMETPIAATTALTGMSETTMATWFAKFRQICGEVISYQGKLKGTDADPIKINESEFAGEKKYRKRKLNGAKPSTNEDIDRPWVFGLGQNTKCRYFHVKRRDRDTILPIIQRECEPGSVIYSEKSPPFGNLNKEGYVHYTCDPILHYEDPNTGVTIEVVADPFSDAKDAIFKKMKGVPVNTFQSHLDHLCWKILRRDSDDLFMTFLDDVWYVHNEKLKRGFESSSHL